MDAPDERRDAPFVLADTGDAPLPTEPVFVYAHTREALYRFDASTSALERIGEFGCMSISIDVGDSGDGMTDLAVDANGALFGVGRAMPGSDQHWLAGVDPATGACTLIAQVDLGGAGTRVQGLSFVPAGTLDPSADVLVGVGGDGAYFRIDPATARATSIGTIEAPSDTRGGDFVSVLGASSWLITSDGSLVGFDPVTGRTLSSVAITGAPPDNLGMGLGFWSGTIYAFTFNGLVVAIDADTGAATEVSVTGTSGVSFRGAAVTTVAPLI